ncbi:carbamoyl-phosphate synthase L chain, ATP binding domain-containing protein [Aspergillus bertholletiae]|uniref:Carbamoyl-phosphate synthase L chain, ATP binding domain-containing protein n=1 Tax=Aspergillus bertholletiae TaxID=1226010 RepID=A0A5N7BKV2_9EURO|nr:carbamoyl-phosphate synthase L chain, ATP binding domain-containing protein [Aspergillus bertholletiae]
MKKQLNKVLVANRGEIAVRIIRACHDYGVGSVAVFSDLDVDSPFVRLADEAYGLKGLQTADTYLNIDKLIAVAKRSGADAIHPGYGFLSERAEFAQAVQDAGLTWIGPDPSVIEALGDKVEARRIALRVGAPLVAGSDGPVSTGKEAVAFARQHGLPIAIKAAHGGGGRGLKVAWTMDEVAECYESAVREATAAFGRGECFIERFLDRPRHIEAQVLADRHGNVVVVGTRDCSVQRRHQKLIEEAPAPFLTIKQQENIQNAAQSICSAAGYSSAGTVEFLLGIDGSISFLEVNTRLQVEHPFRIADGLPLSISSPIPPRGHSIEFRINAEDPGRGFLPTPGQITTFQPPSGPGIRLDSGVVQGSTIPAVYDSLMAKLVVSGATREQALRRARRALTEFQINGVATVLPFHMETLSSADFLATNGFNVHTRWVETDFAATLAAAPRPDPMPAQGLIRTHLEIDGKLVSLGLPSILLGGIGPAVAGEPVTAKEDKPKPDNGDIPAPLSGTLRAFKVPDGASVRKGDLLAVLEAMKMETQVTAPRDGIVRLLTKEGEYVQAGHVILTFEPELVFQN